jgi:hypothetical protein
MVNMLHKVASTIRMGAGLLVLGNLNKSEVTF